MNNENKTRCSNCKCWREPEMFLNKLNVILKRCIKCREKDAKRKQRPDVIQKNKERNKEKKYYQTYRDKKRAENEEKYLEHNAELARNWRTNNKEHFAKWQTNDFRTRLYAIKRQAQIKGIQWNENMTDQLCYQMMTSNCFYCDFLSNETLNGIDRMDSMIGYSQTNSVSCCKKCNFMKGSLDANTFINRCKHISKHFGGNGIINKQLWVDSQAVSYEQYKKRASLKNLEFSLTEKEFVNLQQQKCYYCDKENSDNHRNGIDRMDNMNGYSQTNCVSCCCECNTMKRCLDDNEFIGLCKKISDNKKNHIQLKIPECKKRMNKRDKNVDIKREKITITKQAPIKEQIHEKIEEYSPKQREYKRGTNLPDNCGIKPEQIPKFCYYVKETSTKGDAFCCSKHHPKQKDIGKDWTTTKSKKISTIDKLKQLLDYLSEQNTQEFDI